MFWCPSVITSWLFTAWWSTWPGNHLVLCVAELVGSCIPIHARRCFPDLKCLPLLFIWSVTVLLCRPLFPCPSRWHGSLPRHGLWWLADLWVTLLRHVSYTRNFFAKYADVKSKKYAKKYAQYYKICVLKYAELRNYKIYALKICGNAEYWKKYAR